MTDLRTQAAQHHAADKQHREELRLRFAGEVLVSPTRRIRATGNHLAAQNDERELALADWPMPAGGPIKSFKQIEAEANASARAVVRGAGTAGELCDECETVDHCLVHGCIPKVPLTEAQLAQGDLENHHLKVSGELERRREHRALQEQQNYLGTGL